MYAGKLVFAQVMEFAPWHTFRRLVAKSARCRDWVWKQNDWNSRRPVQVKCATTA